MHHERIRARWVLYIVNQFPGGRTQQKERGKKRIKIEGNNHVGHADDSGEEGDKRADRRAEEATLLHGRHLRRSRMIAGG